MEQKRNAMSKKVARAQSVLKSGLAGYAAKSVDGADKKVLSWGPMMRK